MPATRPVRRTAVRAAAVAALALAWCAASHTAGPRSPAADPPQAAELPRYTPTAEARRLGWATSAMAARKVG